MTAHYAYRRGPPKAKKPRANPEAALQISVKRYLGWCLPKEVLWTASMTGVNLPIHVADRMKKMGVQRGWPDLQFLCLDGVVRFIELKVDAPLAEEQKTFRDACQCRRNDTWALCRSVDDVIAALTRWGVRLKDHPFDALDPD